MKFYTFFIEIWQILAQNYHFGPKIDEKLQKIADFDHFSLWGTIVEFPKFGKNLQKKLEASVESLKVKHDRLFVVTGPLRGCENL